MSDFMGEIEFSSFDMAKIAENLAKQYQPEEGDPWLGSPFRWIKPLPSRTIGKVGEELVEQWCSSKGFLVEKSPDSEADRLLEGHRVEVKFSTLWKEGIYKFQQIRDQNYDFCFCLGVSPFEVHAWLLPKDLLQKHVIGHMGQHTGAGASDTAWISFKPGEEYEWMKPHGGTLGKVLQILDSLKEK